MTILRTAKGRVQGIHERTLHTFKGIPYAEPLVGRACWLPPAPRRAWSEVRDARSYGPACMQFDQELPGPMEGARRQYLEAIDELRPPREGDDCLLLNVWTPTLDTNARRPVMVYIHGGGLHHGAANELYDASSFALKGAVAVVIQYRLGPLGFLHGETLFGGAMCADNRGFLDQIEALRWVQENIAGFGGDAANVTIFGESAGAFSVYQLAASPLAKGLFKRAIAMGGMPHTHAPAAEYHRLARDVLQEVGIKPGDSDGLAALDEARLRELQAAVVRRIFMEDAPDRYGSISQVKWSCLGAATGTDFLPAAPLPAYEAGTPNDIDLLLGTCGDDGQLFSYILPDASQSAQIHTGFLRGFMPGGDADRLVARYRTLMPGASELRVHEAVNNDAFFRMPTLSAAEAHARGHAGRTYLYQVDFASGISGVRAVHGIEIALLFGELSPAKTMLAPGPASSALCEQMLSALVSFAATGRPKAPGLPEWAVFEPGTRNTMVFDTVTRVERDWGKPFREIWSSPAAPAA